MKWAETRKTVEASYGAFAQGQRDNWRKTDKTAGVIDWLFSKVCSCSELQTLLNCLTLTRQFDTNALGNFFSWIGNKVADTFREWLGVFVWPDVELATNTKNYRSKARNPTV